MRINFEHEVQFGADVAENGVPDDRVTYSISVEGVLLAKVIYKLGKETVELTDLSKSMTRTFLILSRAFAEFDRRGDWSDFEFDLEL